jgi:hypothetical protein
MNARGAGEGSSPAPPCQQDSRKPTLDRFAASLPAASPVRQKIEAVLKTTADLPEVPS